MMTHDMTVLPPGRVSPRDPLVLGYACGLGARHRGCADGPEWLRREGPAWVNWGETVRASADEGRSVESRVSECCAALAVRVSDALKADRFPVVVAGDHTCGAGTWSGVTTTLGACGRFGLIWIDAHMDAHTYETTETGNLHGMVLACLLGYGPVGMAGIGADRPHLDPRHVSLVGVRSFESGEAALLKRLGVRVYLMEEVHARGITTVLDEALARANDGTAGFGVSLDMDSFDPEESPGVGTPEPDGLHAPIVLDWVARVAKHPALRGFELVEFNPHRDRDGATAAHMIAGLEAVSGRRRVARVTPAALEDAYGAHNYAPGPVTLVRGRGAYVWDDSGRRYFDMMSAYSALSHGHAHPRLVRVLREQAGRLAVTSRAFANDRLGVFLEKLCRLTGMETALPMNTGAEAVETGLKAARKWAHRVKGVPEGAAEIIACGGNFHGRTIAIVGMSTEPQYRYGFGAFPSGLRTVPYGDAAALEAAITPNTAAFVVEPIQGEGGIRVPPPGYLAACAAICRRHNVLLLADEIQTGLGRTGRMLCCDHEGVAPDGLMLGKALGGGLLPVSAFLARREVMAVFTPGDHGSTFGGNPLAAAVAAEALDVLVDEDFCGRAESLGVVFRGRLAEARCASVAEVRGRGLMVGVEIAPGPHSAHDIAGRLRERGVLTKETHHTVLRFAPPLVITRDELDRATDIILDVLSGQ